MLDLSGVWEFLPQDGWLTQSKVRKTDASSK